MDDYNTLSRRMRACSGVARVKEAAKMADYERTTTHEHAAVDPVDTRHSTTAASDRVVSTEREYVAAGPTPGEMIRRVVTLVFGILQAALVLRLILLLLVANPGNDVVSFILGITDPFVEPFRGMFQLDRVRADQGSVLDIAAIVALVAWTLIEALVLAALSIGARRSQTV